jgi:dihydrofolate reductase
MKKRKLVLYSAVSLDGYIAGPDGDIDWLNESRFTPEGEDYGYENFYATIGATIMGHNTFRKIQLLTEEFPYARTANYVLSKQQGEILEPAVELVTREANQFVLDLKQEDGKDIWLVGGGQINTLMAKHNLIDEMILTYIPLILGSGISLFDGEMPMQGFMLHETRTFFNGIIQSTYRKMPGH